MLLQACLNGARPRRFHPRLPLTPAAIAEDAAEAVAAGAAERLVELGLGPSVLRILVEIEEQAEEEAMAAADAILAILSRAGIAKPILLHGVDRMMWPFVERAARERYSTRVGLEDGATLPDGTTAPSNAALVAAAAKYLRKGQSA